MSLHGDLSTLDLTNLFQNLEGARKTGLLTVRGEGQDTELFFDEGKLASISYPERPPLVEFLVAAGAVGLDGVDRAKKRKKRGKGMGAALVDAEAISAEQLTEIAAARLVDEACEVLAAGATKFEFAEVDAPSAAFDPDERALGIALAASPLLLESARRTDHWALIREHVPSDSTHFTVVRTPTPPADPAKARFFSDVLELVDGSRNVREVVGRFPARRFDAYLLLADLAKSHAIRPIPAADLNARVLELARRDRKRALALLERGLEQNPHHLALLATKAMLAEKMGDLEQASEALKLVVHLQLEEAGEEEARATLERLKEIDEEDPFVWEKSFELAVEQGRREDAIEDGRTLAQMLRKRGLAKKVVAVLERLSRLAEPSWEFAQELARARADAGERDAAVKGLEAFAASRIRIESYPLACKAYEEVLAIHPGRAKAKETLKELQTGAIAQKKARWRRLRRRALILFFVVVVLPWVAGEALAGRAYVAATKSIVHERLLEGGRYAEARDRYAAVRKRYPWTTTAQFEIEPVIQELDALIADPSAAGPR